MKYKDDWLKSKERFEAYWKGEIVDRCCVSVCAPKNGHSFPPEPVLSSRQDLDRFWKDLDWRLKRGVDCFESTYYGGDALPIFFINFGPSGMPPFFKSSQYRFEKDTAWYFPFINDWEKDFPRPDPNSEIRRLTVELAKLAVEKSKGDFLVDMPDIGGCFDILGHMRGGENLMLDIMEDDPVVFRALDVIYAEWFKIMNDIFPIVDKNNYGGSCIGWLNLWGPGKTAHLQSDLSVMMSPESAKKYVLPELNMLSNRIDNSLYHLDGCEQIRHLDMLLSIKNLKAIQWTQVAGQPSVLEFIPELRRIQKAGKNLLIMVEVEQFEKVMAQLSSKGLYLLVSGAKTEDDAKSIVKIAEKLTHE